MSGDDRTTTPKNPTVRASRRYTIELSIGMSAYVVILIATRFWLASLAQPWLTIAALAPALPLLYAFFAVIRLLHDTDEFARKLIVESAAVAGGITAVLAATYGFAEGPHLLPHPSAWATWTTFMALWLIASFVIRVRYR